MTTSNASSWNDFNDADTQSGFDLIPKGTLVPVRMTLKPGGFDEPAQGWTGGYATQSFETGAVYLSAEFVVTGGDFAKRKLWSNIGLYSAKGPTWGQMGRSFLRAALNSARNVHPQDNSPPAVAISWCAAIALVKQVTMAPITCRASCSAYSPSGLSNPIASAAAPKAFKHFCRHARSISVASIMSVSGMGIPWARACFHRPYRA